MSPRIPLLLLAFLPTTAVAETPIAQVICAPRAEMEARLATQYRAELQGMGMRGNDAVIEVWADDHGRWTLVQRWAGGQSCILAMGEGWTGMATPPA